MPIRENTVPNVIKQFSRFAYQYTTYNIIQAEVAHTLVEKLSQTKYIDILDIGCGSGEVYKNIKKRKIGFDTFIALDASQEMLALHPTHARIQKICADFNAMETFTKLDYVTNETLLISSSALQWSKNLDFVFAQLSKKSTNAYFAIFTANTFKTLHKTAQIESPIYSEGLLKETIEKYYHATFELQRYKLKFKTVREMFKYIKKSGVSGGDKQLHYRQMKTVMDEYPLDYLEFEVLFVEATSLA